MFWLRLIYSRLYGLLRKNRIEQEMDDEMRFHLLMRTRENIERGMRPDEAEREARRRFGNVGRIKDLARDIKGGGFMETLLQDLRYGARMLMKNPGFTLVVVITLALGIGANTAIFSLVNGVLLRPLPYAEPERLVRVFENFKKRNLSFAGLTAPGFLDWRAQQTVFEDIAAYQAIGFDLTGEGESRRVLGMRASAGFFSLLRIRPALGRGFTAAEDIFGKGQVVMLSHRFWRERFNGANEALGKSLTLNGAAYMIVGVLPAGLQLTGLADADV
ncbi:MAG TPA: ABC transporter permease, partial [Blastocatellia bacterium]|nr:ABC transporter permease [Blastocatellia bacterium]